MPSTGKAAGSHRYPETNGSTDLTEVCAQLRCLARSLDALWRDTQTTSAGPLSMRLGDASHAVHRALIALQEDRRPLMPGRVATGGAR